MATAYGACMTAFINERKIGMLRGTTPTNTFELPFDATNIEEVVVIYAQNDVEVFQKNTADCEIKDNVITVKLTQEETLMLNHKVNVQIQVWVKTKGNDVVGSDIIVVDVDKCLKDGVM